MVWSLLSCILVESSHALSVAMNFEATISTPWHSAQFGLLLAVGRGKEVGTGRVPVSRV